MSADVRERLQGVFRELFMDPSIVLSDETTAKDIEGWDSLAHITLIIMVEKTFGIKFATSEISRLKGDNQTMKDFLSLIEGKLGDR